MVAWTGASPFLFVTACVSRPPPPADIVVALAPTGRLRASINLGNPILARRDPVTGEAVSVPVDLARELAEHRGVGIVPYVLIEGAYLVRQGSPLRDNAEVDRPCTRIVVGKGSAYDLFLTRELKAAQALAAFVESAKGSGFMAGALQRHNIQGAVVAPARRGVCSAARPPRRRGSACPP